MVWWKIRDDIFKRDSHLVNDYYPCLEFQNNGSILSLEGEFVIKTNSGIPKSIRIKIEFPKDYPKSTPKAYDVENKFGGYNPNRHINTDNSFCLYLPEKVNFDFVKKHTILNFLDILVVFLRKQFIFERAGKWPGYEEPHGIEALEILYYGKFIGADSPEIRKKLRKYWETKLKVGRNNPCPCGNNKKYKKCHLPFIDKMKSLRSRYRGKH